MWDKVLLILCIGTLTYFLKSYGKVYNWIVFHLQYFLLYSYCMMIIFVWPFPIFNGRTIENGKPWSRALKPINIVFGLDWEIRNSEVLTKKQGAVIVSNHQSSIDGLAMFRIWESLGKAIFLIKREIMYILPAAVAVYFAGGILLDRRNPKIAYKQLQKAANILNNEQAKIWLYPEGTRNHDYTTFLPFRKGPFTMAINAQVPVIPVVFSPYYFIDRKNYKVNKSRVIVQCLEEIPTKGLTIDDVPELTEKARNVMLAAYKKLSEEVLPNMPKSAEFAPN